MASDPPLSELAFLMVAFSPELVFSILLLAVLIISSALISGSEVAFFSLSPNDLHALEDDDTASSKKLLNFKKKPRSLLATILISNNFINIGIVLVSNYIIRQLIGDQQLQFIGSWIQSTLGLQDILSVSTIAYGFNFLIAVIGVTFILVLFGEVAPKIYANLNNLKFAKMMSTPLSLLNIIFGPFSSIMVKWSTGIENRITAARINQTGTSKEDIDKAIELTVANSENADQEADMLKSIVKFGDVSAKQIMKSRVDVVAVEEETNFRELMKMVKESGYSRIPVYKEDFDNLSGILYVKDLLGHTDEDESFNWRMLIRESVIYIPESKKIDDLLKEFQKKRTHIAIVVDEYGGSAGIVTLEDIMEEVIGDIKDEFDEDEEVDYIRLSEGNYIFEGKTLLNDLCRILGEDTDYFDAVRGDSDSLAGLLIEMIGRIPKPEKEVVYNNIVFKVIAVSQRRIEKINVRIEK